MIKATMACSISVISNEANFALFKHFGFRSGRDVDKFSPEEINTLGKELVDLGSHTLFICEPTFMTVLSDAPSCTYEYYQNEIKPKPQAVGTTPKGETVWRCTICDYEYVGEDLPDDFTCPLCSVGKDDFTAQE